MVLLRGINVGGHGRLPMADLRAVVEGLGHTEVATYIQSGNLVLTTSLTDTDAIALDVERAIRTAAPDLRTGAVVLSRADFAQVVADNPFPMELDPKHLHVTFRREAMTVEIVAAVAAAQDRARARGSRDEAAVVGRHLYLRTPDGLGRSELAAQLSRPAARGADTAVTTTRNWATVTRLLTMVAG